MNQAPFHKRARKQIKGLVNQRLLLLKQGKSFRDSAVYSAEELKKLLDYWPYDKDTQMAQFVINKLNHILNIIPRGKNPAFEKKRLDILALKNEAITILNGSKIISRRESL